MAIFVSMLSSIKFRVGATNLVYSVMQHGVRRDARDDRLAARDRIWKYSGNVQLKSGAMRFDRRVSEPGVKVNGGSVNRTTSSTNCIHQQRKQRNRAASILASARPRRRQRVSNSRRKINDHDKVISASHEYIPQIKLVQKSKMISIKP